MAAAGSVDDPEAFAAFVEGLPAAVQPLVRAADALVRRVHPDVTQVVWPHQRTVGYGIGPRKMSEHYAYLAIYDRHLNLGCNYGAALPDPTGLLGGTGAAMRSRRITAVEDLADPAWDPLLAAAVAERRSARGRG